MLHPLFLAYIAFNPFNRIIARFCFFSLYDTVSINFNHKGDVSHSFLWFRIVINTCLPLMLLRICTAYSVRITCVCRAMVRLMDNDPPGETNHQPHRILLFMLPVCLECYASDDAHYVTTNRITMIFSDQCMCVYIATMLWKKHFDLFKYSYELGLIITFLSMLTDISGLNYVFSRNACHSMNIIMAIGHNTVQLLIRLTLQ